MRRAWLVLSLLAPTACAHPQGPEPVGEAPAELESPGGVKAEPTELGPPVPARAARPAPRDGISRLELDAILDAGPARFLQRVNRKAVLRGGKFLGWRIIGLDPLLEGVVGPGDILVRVNRRSMERPEVFFEVWQSLRRASELVLEILREDKPMEIRLPIR